MDSTIVSIAGLTKRYGALTAVDGLSLDIREGEILALLGPNGAGKTTTINMVAGLQRPDSGSIEFRTPGRGQGRRAVGYCPQDIVVWETLTCLEQLVYLAEMHDVPRREARRRALALLEAMDLADRRDRLARSLSGGMRRRLNIVLALVHEPALVILDEPQAGLDPQSRVLVREYIGGLRQRATVILTTHDMEEAEKLADRVAIVDRGRLLALDTPEGLKQSRGFGEVLELGLAGNGEAAAAFSAGLAALGMGVVAEGDRLLVAAPEVIAGIERVLAAARDGGFVLENLRVRRRSLEDVFISLTGRGLRE